MSFLSIGSTSLAKRCSISSYTYEKLSLKYDEYQVSYTLTCTCNGHLTDIESLLRAICLQCLLLCTCTIHTSSPSSFSSSSFSFSSFSSSSSSSSPFLHNICLPYMYLHQVTSSYMYLYFHVLTCT